MYGDQSGEFVCECWWLKGKKGTSFRRDERKRFECRDIMTMSDNETWQWQMLLMLTSLTFLVAVPECSHLFFKRR